MIITCKSETIVKPVIPAAQLVNKVGKYIYEHLDGAYKLVKTANTCDVYITILYSIPSDIVKRYGLEAGVHEMTLNLSITHYQNKIRVNIYEMSPEECTIGFDLFPPGKLQDLEVARDLIYSKVRKRIEKYYDGWEFIF